MALGRAPLGPRLRDTASKAEKSFTPQVRLKRFEASRSSKIQALLVEMSSEALIRVLQQLTEEVMKCALSLRQLRGREAEADVALHQGAPLAESPQVDELAEPIEVTPATAPETAETTTPAEAAVAAAGEEDEREAEEGGTCCFSGENMKDMCGTCYPMSIASYKSKCSKKNNCAGCGGTWCASKCVIGAADPYRKCQTAYPTGTSKDPVCSRDAAG
eukprot:g22262.t1